MGRIARVRHGRHMDILRRSRSYIHDFLTARADTTGNGGVGDTAALTTVTFTNTNAASAVGTLTLTGNAVAAETVTIDGIVYTWRAVPALPYEVDIGADASASLDNLIAAINAAAGEGTLYGDNTRAHPTVTAAAGAGDTMVVTAKVAGTGGNAITTTDTMSVGGWGAGTLASGAVGDTVSATAHGFVTGQGPFVLSNSGGALPTGLSATQLYYAIRLDANTFQLATSQEAAIKGSYATFSTNGTGTNRIARAANRAGLAAWLQRGKKPATVAALTDIDSL
jgi:hypothetical protein